MELAMDQLESQLVRLHQKKSIVGIEVTALPFVQQFPCTIDAVAVISKMEGKWYTVLQGWHLSPRCKVVAVNRLRVQAGK